MQSDGLIAHGTRGTISVHIVMHNHVLHSQSKRSTKPPSWESVEYKRICIHTRSPHFLITSGMHETSNTNQSDFPRPYFINSFCSLENSFCFWKTFRGQICCLGNVTSLKVVVRFIFYGCYLELLSMAFLIWSNNVFTQTYRWLSLLFLLSILRPCFLHYISDNVSRHKRKFDSKSGQRQGR